MMKKTMAVFVCLPAVLLAACASAPLVSGLVSLEDAVSGAVVLVEERAQSGDEIALAKIASPLPALSDFLGSELDSRFNATGKLAVLARGQTLGQVDIEHQVQMSGLVDDESAVGIGHYLGAKMIITGDFNRFDNFSQLYIRAVDVATAQVLATYSAKIDNRDPVLAGLTAPLRTRGAVSEAALEHLNLGREYYAAGLPDIAIEEFNLALRGNRNFAEAWLYRGNVYAGKGDNDQAMADYTAALRSNPRYADALKNRANAYVKEKDYNRAIADYTAALRIDPNDAEALVYRGIAYTERGFENDDDKDYDRAIADCTAALRIDPNNVFALWERGRVYALKDDDDQAIAEFTAALRIDPHNARLYINRAIVYESQRDYDHAIAEYTAALSVDPGDWTSFAYSGRGDAYRAKGDYDRAIADYTAALEIHPDRAWYYISRGDAYRAKGDYDRAIDDYTEALEIDPGNVWAYSKRGDAYFDQGDYWSAEEDYEEAVRLAPNNTSFKNDLERARKETAPLQLPDDIDDYTDAQWADPGNAWAYSKHGDAYYGPR
jgi:tetratricopeptide (TPR) repeat protein